MTGKDTIIFSQEGFSKYRDLFVLPLQLMVELGCTTISQFAATLALERFDKSLRDEWTKTFKSINEVPSLEDITSFLEPLEHNLLSLTLDDQTTTLHSSNRRSSSFGPRANSTSSSACSICQEQHHLHRCPVFVKYDVARRNKHIREKKLCLNCLGSGHLSSNCKSSYTCRECRGRHHSMLYRATNPLTPPDTS